MDEAYHENRALWNQRAVAGELYATPALDREFENPLAVVDQCGWLGGDVRGKRLLCLAAGGGRHSVLFASAGAVVTVVDLSPRMLELDRQVARDRGLSIRVVESSMDCLGALDAKGFDIVVQPVSTCYVADIRKVYLEVARVLKGGGVYVSQHKQPASLQAEAFPAGRGYLVTEPYARKGALPPVRGGHLHREAGAAEFLHTWEDLIGGMCKAGFVIEDLKEPRHAKPDAAPGTPGHRAAFLPPFVKVKARRVEEARAGGTPLWTPG